MYRACKAPNAPTHLLARSVQIDNDIDARDQDFCEDKDDDDPLEELALRAVSMFGLNARK
jgi:hypothetical protein